MRMIWEQLLNRLTSPLYRNSLYLMAGAFISAAAGFVFWWVSARLTSSAAVGLATSMIASIEFIKKTGEMGISSTIIHFGAKKGEDSYRIVNALVCIRWLIGVIFTLVFVATIPVFSPGLLPIFDTPTIVFLFIGFTLFDAILSLQDVVMLNLGHGWYVFLRQLVCNVPPTLILIGLYLVAPQADYRLLFMSFIIPNLIVALITSYYLIPRYLPDYHMFGAFQWQLTKSLMPYGLTNYVGNQLWGLPSVILPLVTINIIDAESAGIFNISWLIFTALLIIPRVTETSMFVESSKAPKDLVRIALQTISFIFILITPMMFILWFGSGLVLGFFGEAYTNTVPLKILLLSIYPFVINGNFFTQLRTRDKRVALILFTSLLSVSTIIGLLILPNQLGLVGISYAWLIGQSITAIVPITVVILFMMRRRKN